jgi:hypothetical protein
MKRTRLLLLGVIFMLLALGTTSCSVAISTASLPDGVQDQPYLKTLTVAGGTIPYFWSLRNGTLPDGLSLNQITGEISGTPTKAGAPVAFTVRVTDRLGNSATKRFSIAIAPASTGPQG